MQSEKRKTKSENEAPVRAVLIFAFRFSLFAFLPSCTLGPNYKPPNTPVPASFSLPTPDPAARTSEVTAEAADVARWWTVFNDPLLTSLIERAAVANYDARAAESRIRQARASRAVVAGGLFPDLSAGASARRSRSPTTSGGETTGRTGNLFQAGLDAAWEIDVFGGLRRSIEASDAGVQASIEDRRNVMVTLASEVALNYADLRGQQEQLRVSLGNLRAQESTLDITRRKLAAGLDATRLDVVNAEGQVASTRAGIPTLRAGIRQSIYNLSVLVGREPTALEAELDAAAPIPPVPPRIPAGLPSDLLERRPDIRRAAAALHADTASIGVATADLFPRFSLTGSLGVANAELDNLLRWDRRSWSVGPSVSWPIFAGGRLRANIALAEERAAESLLLYEQTILIALLEVQVALENYAREQERRAALITAVEADRRAVEMSTRLYMEGQTDFLSVLTAQRALLGSEGALAQSTRTLTANLIALYKALGGGWESFDAAGAR